VLAADWENGGMCCHACIVCRVRRVTECSASSVKDRTMDLYRVRKECTAVVHLSQDRGAFSHCDVREEERSLFSYIYISMGREHTGIYTLPKSGQVNFYGVKITSYVSIQQGLKLEILSQVIQRQTHSADELLKVSRLAKAATLQCPC